MKANLIIKNFRVFDENGVTIELNPITILTGCNSSGKSSVVKAVFLLNSFLSQIKNDLVNGVPIRLDEYKLDFSSYPNNLLGRFDRVVNSDSSTKKVMMEYTVYSLMLSKDVTVQWVFSADSNDELNNAHLESVSMRTDDGVFFSSSKTNSDNIFGKSNIRNYNVIKQNCIDFLQIDFLINYYCSIEAGGVDGSISNEEYKEEHAKIIEELKKFDRNRVKDVVNHVYYSNQGFGNIIRKSNASYDVVEWTKEHGSLFMIPVLERLNNVPKNQLWTFFENEILKYDSNHIFSIASKKIVDDFVSSDAETFSEYFMSFERLFLNRQDDRMINGRLQGKGGGYPNFFAGLGISQEYLLYDLRETVRGLVLFDDEESKQEESNEDDSQINAQEFEQWKDQPIGFDMLYEIVMLWNTWAGYDTEENKKFFDHHVSYIGNIEYSHTMVKLLSVFVTELLEELVTPDWCGNMEYVSSSRVSVKRLYPLDVNDDFTHLLKRYFEGMRFSSNDYCWASEKYEINSFLNKWVKKFEIGDSVSIHIDKEGLGVQIRLHKNSGDEGRLLADEGYGITQLVSMLLQIETVILNAKMPKKNNWFGMEAFRKLIDDYDVERLREATIAIEEPEIHLHPKFQSLLADMIVEAFEVFNIHFIVETHSEYLIRKLQVLVAGKGDDPGLKINKEDISILYVNSPKAVAEKGVLQVKRIEICNDGYIDDTFGPGFYDEATNLSQELL